MKLCLDSLTVGDTEPAELIRCASIAGFDQVSLWAQPPAIFPLQLVTPAKAKACLAAMASVRRLIDQLSVAKQSEVH